MTAQRSKKPRRTDRVRMRHRYMERIRTRKLRILVLQNEITTLQERVRMIESGKIQFVDES